MSALSPTARAMLIILAAVALSNLQDTTIKALSGSYPFHQMQAIRSLAALPVVLGYLLYEERRLSAILNADWAFLALRSLVLSCASASYYLTAAAMPLPETVALYFTMPLFVALLSGPLLGERVRLHRLLAVAAGFAGVVVMAKPGSNVFDPAALIGLFCALAFAVGNMMTKPLGPSVPTSLLAVYLDVFFLLTALLLAAVFGSGSLTFEGHASAAYLSRPWVWPTAWDLGLLTLIGFVTGSLMILFAIPYRLTEASFIAPFEYSAMVWAILFSFLFFGDVPDVRTLAGIGLIIGAGLFMLALDRYIGSRSQRAARADGWHRARDPSGPGTRPERTVTRMSHEGTAADSASPGRRLRHADRRT